MCEQNKTLTPHRFASVLVAIAEGREVQYKHNTETEWKDIVISPLEMNFSNSSYQWRVKPKIVRKYCYAYECKNGLRNVTPPHYLNDEDFVDRNYTDKIVWFQRLDNSCVECET